MRPAHDHRDVDAGFVWGVRMRWVPMEMGYIPVITAERAGAQTPAVENANG